MPPPDSQSAEAFAAAAAEADLRSFLRSYSRSLGFGLLAAAVLAGVASRYLSAGFPWHWLTLCAALLLTQWVAIGALKRVPRLEARHGYWATATMVLDGLAWGSLAWMLLGQSDEFDRWIGVWFSAVLAVNALVSVRHPSGFAAQTLCFGLACISGLLLNSGTEGWIRSAAFALLLVVMVVLQRPLARELAHGTRLQLANTNLSDRLQEALNRATQAAMTDTLTGLPNRRAFDAQLASLLAGGARHTFSLLVLDIDHFKLINDRHGHGVGDAVLESFAQRMQATLRPSDGCCRTGGEEFVVLLPNTELTTALATAERLRSAVAHDALIRDPVLHATVSIGVTEFQAGDTARTITGRADGALYRAKSEGRNRVLSTLA
jgi:diguanylate cyclase (GGDEF)-like protein